MSGSAMFTAVTGSTAQQVRIDVIANNLANLPTNGFKRIRPQFEDLMYENIRAPAGEGDSPSGLQFGRGTRIVSTEHVHAPGALRETGKSLDLAIQGDSFFGIQELDGTIGYSRNGAFTLDTNGNIVNANGLPLDPPITIPNNALSVSITQDGFVNYTVPGSSTSSQAGQIQLYRFINKGGLQAIGGNLFNETDSSGSPISGTPGTGAFGTIAQGSLEESNVNVAEELVNLILAQRAFEANTRVISSADDMLRFVTQR